MPKNRKCVVPRCGSSTITNPQQSFSVYPKFSTDRFYEWNKILGIELGREEFYICHKHFDREFFSEFNPIYLNHNKAIPTLFLKNNKSDNETDLALSNLAALPNIKTYGKKRKYDSTNLEEFVTIPNETTRPRATIKFYPGPKTFGEQIEDKLDEFNEIELLRTPEHNLFSERESDGVPQILCSNCESEKQKVHYWWKKYFNLKNAVSKIKRNAIAYKKHFKYIKKQRSLSSKKASSNKIVNEIQRFTHVKEIPRAFCLMILRNKSVKQIYDKQERDIALPLYFKAPSFYNYLKDLGFRLPSRSTINTWLPIKTLSFGIHDDSFLKIKTHLENSTNPQENEYVLVFDEIHIKPSLEYNSAMDCIDGICTDGVHRSNAVGKEVCVFLIRGLLTSWNFVVGHVLSNSAIKGELLEIQIKRILEKCFENNIRIRALVCDQGSNNRALYNILKINYDTPYFIFKNKNFFAFYCTPHLIKSVRNILISNILETSNGMADFKFIKKIYEFDKTNSVKMCPKLTINHIEPNNFAKMRVCLATQIISNSVASAINLSIHLGKFNDEEIDSATAAEILLKKFNDLFDFFNTDLNNLHGNNRFLERNNNDSLRFLVDMKSYIEKIKIVSQPGKRKKTVYAFNGFLQNINALIGMSKHIFEDYDIEILPTRRLNQDILENMFSLVRSKGGNNRNPSPKEFNNALKFLMNMKIIVPEIKRKAANCTFDSDLENSYNNINLMCEDIDVAETIVESPNTEESEPYEDNFNISEVQLSAIKVDDEQVNNVVTYFVSYVTNKIIQRNKCDECCSHLLKERNIIIPREYLLNIKFESKAQTFSAASAKFFELCRMYIHHFQQTFAKRIHFKYLKENYKRECIDLTNKIDSSWFAETNNCYNHRIKALDFLLLILIRKNCFWILDEKKSIYTN